VNLDDTIVAIATPPGRGGIGVVRLAGPEARAIAAPMLRLSRELEPGRAVRGDLVEPGGAGDDVRETGTDSKTSARIDEVVVTFFAKPHSYTTDDVVEISAHGSPVVLRHIVELSLAGGARLAEPGEFTKRAFLHGRINLSQAEAVYDLISAWTDESRRIAVEQLQGGLSKKLAELRRALIENCSFLEAYIDFPDEEIETKTREQTTGRLLEIRQEIDILSATFQDARFFREGLSVAIVGRPNVGKSSLLNSLLKKDKAIVTEIPGTTRDLIEDYLNINGLPVRIIDTAGIRNSTDLIEKEGIRRSLDAIEKADFVIAIFDGSEALTEDDKALLRKIQNKNALIAVNKSDLPVEISLENIRACGKQYVRISAIRGEGLEELKSAIFDSNLRNWKEEREGIVITNLRHKLALERASSSLSMAMHVLNENQPLEIFSIELREALDHIGEITGAVTTEEILDKIFSTFCIGK